MGNTCQVSFETRTQRDAGMFCNFDFGVSTIVWSEPSPPFLLHSQFLKCPSTVHGEAGLWTTVITPGDSDEAEDTG
jgi:hypothetical protein